MASTEATPPPPQPAPQQEDSKAKAKTEPENESYPPVIPGGSLIIAYQLRGKKVLIVGGGNVAASRLYSLLCADAHVTIISPPPLHPEIQHRLQTHPQQITYISRPFSADVDLPRETAADTYAMVLTAIDDPIVSSEIYKLCHALHIPVNIADVPSECDFYFGSIYRDGPVQIMVSTNGKGPRMAALIKDRVRDALSGADSGESSGSGSAEKEEREGGKLGGVGQAVEKVGELRKKLREIAPERELGPKRMQWISMVSDKWSLKELAGLQEGDIQSLLESWEKWKLDGGDVPGLEDVRK